MHSTRLLLAVVLCLTLPDVGAAGECTQWGPPTVVGQLDASVLPEASGLAVSRRFADRVYHINDSGNGPYFFVSDSTGRGLQRIRIDGLGTTRSDFEDLAVGPCGASTCLVIGDIGDNRHRRSTVRLVWIEERKHFGMAVRPRRIVSVAYPDGPRDAEAVGVHPNGDVFVLSKGVDGWFSVPKLFRLPRSAIEARDTGTRRFEYVGPLSLAGFGADSSFFGTSVTAFDIAPDGSRFLVLTYRDAFEFHADLSRGAPEGDGHRCRIALRALPQQEAVAYLPNGCGFLYDSEHRAGEPVELVRVDCASGAAPRAVVGP
jgi:hypothetical protein